MPCWPSSMAPDFTRAISPALAAPYAECLGAPVMPDTDATNTIGPPPVSRIRRALRRVARPGGAVHLLGHVGRQALVLVDAERAGADRRQRVRRLAADALTGADDHEAAVVEA